MHCILTRALTLMQFITVTNPSGQEFVPVMLYRDESWFQSLSADGRQRAWHHMSEHFADVSGVNRVAHDSGGVWVKAGKSQVHFISEIWLHRDTKVRSCGALSYNLCTTMTSSFSMPMHDSLLQGTVHISWQLKMSQFFRVLHTHQISLERSGLVYTIQRFLAPTNIWVGQNSPGQYKQNDQHCMKKMGFAATGKWWSKT